MFCPVEKQLKACASLDRICTGPVYENELNTHFQGYPGSVTADGHVSGKGNSDICALSSLVTVGLRAENLNASKILWKIALLSLLTTTLLEGEAAWRDELLFVCFMIHSSDYAN